MPAQGAGLRLHVEAGIAFGLPEFGPPRLGIGGPQHFSGFLAFGAGLIDHRHILGIGGLSGDRPKLWAVRDGDWLGDALHGGAQDGDIGGVAREELRSGIHVRFGDKGGDLQAGFRDRHGADRLFVGEDPATPGEKFLKAGFDAFRPIPTIVGLIEPDEENRLHRGGQGLAKQFLKGNDPRGPARGVTEEEGLRDHALLRAF